VLIVAERELRAEPVVARERARAFPAAHGAIGREEGSMGARDEGRRDWVVQIDAMTWEGVAAVDPVGPGWPVEEWLALARAWGLALRMPPISVIGGDSPHAGGHVLLAEAWGDRLYFVIPTTAIPALGQYLLPDEYAELLRRTLPRWRLRRRPNIHPYNKYAPLGVEPGVNSPTPRVPLRIAPQGKLVECTR
jgi:hypothetical protein